MVYTPSAEMAEQVNHSHPSKQNHSETTIIADTKDVTIATTQLVTVELKASGFDPAVITVITDSTVIWRNTTTSAETLSSGVLLYAPIIVVNQAWDASSAQKTTFATETFGGNLPANGGVYSYTFNTVGEYPYYLSSQGAFSGKIIVIGIDVDGDRLANSVETNTGIYVSPTNTGTDPNNPDTDGDKLSDGDETLGTTAGLNLPGMGANPLKKNILLEYDWFDDNLDPGTCSAHSHRPSLTALNKVTSAFANSPVSNPNGTSGVTVIHDYGQGGLFTGGNLINDADGVLSGGVNNSEFKAYKLANFASNRNGYFHYVLLPHRYNTGSGSSGQAELPGNDLIVSLYCYGSDNNVANTIVHELGHNLFLRHGGNENTNYKPNYNSVMNYKYQFPGVDTTCDANGDGLLNYSTGVRISLNESNLNENLGVCGATPIDWDGNSIIQTGVVSDVNNDFSYTILNDYNDWANLYFTGLQDADGASPFPPEIITEDPIPEWARTNN